MINSIDTMTYWPAKIKKPDDIPANIKSEAAEKNYSVLFPPLPFQLFKDKTKILTLCSSGIEYAEQGLCHFLDFSDISSIEWTSVLLKGILRIFHIKRIYNINFNSSRNDYIVPFIESYRAGKAVSSSEHDRPFYHCRELEFLIKQNLKLFNITGDSISSKDKISKFIYQHPFTSAEKKVPLFMKFFSPYLIIGLEKEWLLIKEDKQKTTKTGTYGWIKQYIQKEMVESVTVSEETLPDYVIFNLKGNYDFRLPVSTDNLKQIKDLLKP